MVGRPGICGTKRSLDVCEGMAKFFCMNQAIPYLIKAGKFILKSVILAAIAAAAGKLNEVVDQKL